MRNSMLKALAVGAMAIASSADAAPCAGFTDVEDTDPFCSSVTWMKNRGVTLGCQLVPAPLYCPNDNVTRLQMAAFMERMARKTTYPVWVDANGKTVGPVMGASNAYWRSQYGPAVISIDFSNNANAGQWLRPTWTEPHYPTGDCSGQAYVGRQQLHTHPVLFYWRASQYRLLRVQQLVAPASMPGPVYNVSGNAFVSYWSGNEATNSCQITTIHISDLWVQADDLADITNEFVGPFKIE